MTNDEREEMVKDLDEMEKNAKIRQSCGAKALGDLEYLLESNQISSWHLAHVTESIDEYRATQPDFMDTSEPQSNGYVNQDQPKGNENN